MTPRKDYPELDESIMDRIISLQNHEKNVNQDHLTITGFMTTIEELINHERMLNKNTQK
jgi:hypothetical protein